MMENQETLNPKEEYYNIQQEIQGGNVEMAQRWANGEFKDLREEAMSFEVTPTEVHDTDIVTVGDEQPSEEPTPIPVEEESDEFDPIEHERKVYDEEIARHEQMIKNAEAERIKKELEAEEIRKQNEKLLKELEETRKANDVDEEDDFFGTGVEKVTEAVETLPTNTETVDTTGIQEIKAELEQLKRQQLEKDGWERTVKSYNDFWTSSVGQEFAPDGKREDIMQSFNGFYTDLANNINERDALRLMHDIRKNGINDFYQQKLDSVGIKLPEEFDKMYDSMEIAAFAEGKKIDPKMGKFVESGRGNFGSFEDAYFILNKDTIIAKERQKSFKDMQNKLNEKTASAVQLKPNEYQPISTAVDNVINSAYREALIRQAHSAGYDGISLDSIRHPEVKSKMQELHATINKLRR